jgi:hypothetical protein
VDCADREENAHGLLVQVVKDMTSMFDKQHVASMPVERQDAKKPSGGSSFATATGTGTATTAVG